MSQSRAAKGREIWSFFTGAAGLDLGLEATGLAPTLGLEIDADCCATLRTNRPSVDTWEIDISKVDAGMLSDRRKLENDVFLMVGGPPCQSFSSGGKRAALSDPRGNLIYTYLALVGQVRPQYFVLENVANLVTAAVRHRPIADRPGKAWNLSSYKNDRTKGDRTVRPMEEDELSGSAIRQVFSEVQALGYAVNFAVLDAADYGAPQHRHRFVMIGSRNGTPVAIPDVTHGPLSQSGQPWKTLRDAIYDLRDTPGPHSVYGPDMAKYFSMVPPGGTWRSLPCDIQEEALGPASFAAGGGKTGFFRRLSWETPSPTITGRSNRKATAVCHPDHVRPISVKESARLQGFPDDWTFEGSMSSQYMQVGNAVPISLGVAIGIAIANHSATVAVQPVINIDVDHLLATATAKLRATARNKRQLNKHQLSLF